MFSTNFISTVGSGQPPFDPDATAFFDRVTLAGGTLTTLEKGATNQLVEDLKGFGIWTLMKAIYPMVGASSQACAQNLKATDFTATFSSGWTFASTGVTPNGAAFMNTGFNNRVDFTSSSNASMGFISRTEEIGVICDMGAGSIGDATNSATIYARFSGNTFFSNMQGTVGTPGSSNTSSIGFFVASRISSLSHTRHKRGSSTIDFTITDGIGSNPNRTIFLGAGNDAGTAISFSSKEFNFAFTGDGLTQTQVDDYFTALQTFNTELSR